MGPPGRLREGTEGQLKVLHLISLRVCPSFLCNSIRKLFDLTLSVNYIITLCNGRWGPADRGIDLITFSFEVDFSLFTETSKGPAGIISGSSTLLLYCELATHQIANLFAKTGQQIKATGS